MIAKETLPSLSKNNNEMEPFKNLQKSGFNRLFYGLFIWQTVYRKNSAFYQWALNETLKRLSANFSKTNIYR